MKSVLRPKNIGFHVERSKPVIVAPAKPTPRETKSLSDIDDQANLRFYAPIIFFYHANKLVITSNPAKVIKEALAKALVFYYPIAGRLREQPDGRLLLECTGDGALFVEAHADVPLHYLAAGDPIYHITPPFPFIDRLQFDSQLMGPGVISQPLLYVQVTRFRCGGLSFTLQIRHIIIDVQGIVQFLTAVSELARGADRPSVLPVWERHLLLARDPPVMTHIHQEYEPIQGATQDEYDAVGMNPLADLVYRSFFFGAKEISALQRHLQPLPLDDHHQAIISRFEITTAAAWRSRTIALDYNPEYEVRVQFPVNSRRKTVPPLPAGYYGNTFARAVALCKAGKLCSSPLEYALSLVREAKARAASSDFIQSLADMTVLRGRPRFMVTARTFMVSDVSHAGFHDIDFGWGEGTFGVKLLPWVVTFYTTFKNGANGEEMVIVPMCLPEQAMARFKKEMEKLTLQQQQLHSLL